MLRIRKYTNERGKSSPVGIALVAAIALALLIITPMFAAQEDEIGPCGGASSSIDLAHIVTMYAIDMGEDQYPGDLNLWNPVTELSGALWDYFPSDQASGTGVFNTYLAVKAPGSAVDERGYNTGGSCDDYNEDDSKTSALPLNAVPIVEIDGTLYREFACDINEVKASNITALISLEVLQIWQSDSDNLCGDYNMSPSYDFTSGEPDLIYDLDCEENYTLIMDYNINTGSGKPDYKVFVPYDWFNEKPWVVMVVDHGNLETAYPVLYEDYGGSDGFEEWGVRIIECCLDVIWGTIDDCYETVEEAEAAAIAATTATDDCGGFVMVTASSTGDPCDLTITVTATDNCGTEMSHDYHTTVELEPADVIGPMDETYNTCDFPDQAALDAAFAAWIAQFQVVTDGCGGTPTDLSGLVAPILCDGGSVPVLYELDTLCSYDSVSATFTVNPPIDEADVIGPMDETYSTCDFPDQAALDAAFAAWIAQFQVVTDGCGGTPTDLSGLVAPILCDGGLVPVLYELDTLCSYDSVSATFTVAAAPALNVTCPDDYVGGDPWCSTDPEITGSPIVSGGCDPQVTYEDDIVPGDTCGWTITRTWNITDLCESYTCIQHISCICCWSDETAWAYGGDDANENWDYADSENWGWTNGPLSEGSYEWDLYAGAGQNDLSKGEVVGMVYVDYVDGCVTVRYEVDEGYYLGETHLWVGDGPLPMVSRGKHAPQYTDAPGQFPYGVDYGFDPGDSDTWETEWTWSNCGFEGDIYVAAHAVVWSQGDCPEQAVLTVATGSSDSGGSFWEGLLNWLRSLFGF